MLGLIQSSQRRKWCLTRRKLVENERKRTQLHPPIAIHVFQRRNAMIQLALGSSEKSNS